MLPRFGILHFVPTSRIAGSEPPVEGSVDIQFLGPTARDGDGNPIDYALQHVSEIVPELADHHLDVGKTMGVRRIIFESFAVKLEHQDVTDLGGLIPALPAPLPSIGFPTGSNFGGIFGSLDRPWVGNVVINGADQGISLPDGGVAWRVAKAALDDQFAAAGGAQIETIERRSRTFSHNDFLLLNLNFKSPIAQTPAANIKWIFATKAAREAAGTFIAKDVGKVALQSDEQSWWILTEFKDIPSSNSKTPVWESQDLRSQIVGGVFNNNIVLFFLPGGPVDPYYPVSNYYHKFRSPGNPVRDLKDQRHLYDILGDENFFGWIEKGKRWSSGGITDTVFGSGFVTGINQDVPGGYPGLNWMDIVLNPGMPAPGRLSIRAGGLGIYNSQAALDAAASSFQKSDIGARAIVLLTQPGPHAYSPDQTVVTNVQQLLSIGPPVFSVVSVVPYSAGADIGAPVDTEYSFYLFPNNPHADFNVGGFRDVDQSYDSPNNPLVHGTLRTQAKESHTGGYVSARFLNTD